MSVFNKYIKHFEDANPSVSETFNIALQNKNIINQSTTDFIMIKHIIFDLGGVVVPEENEEMRKSMSAVLGMPFSAYIKRYLKFAHKATKGKIGLYDIYKRVVKDNNLKISAKKILELDLKLYKKYRQKPRKEMISFIKKLKKRYSVVCLTNTELEIAEIHRKTGLYKIFDKAFVSTEIGMRKPNINIYRKTLKDLKAKPRECVFIDDKKPNITAAKRLGMHGFVYKNYNKLKKDLKRISIVF